MNNEWIIIQNTQLDIGPALQAALLAARRRHGTPVVLLCGDALTDDVFAVAVASDLQQWIGECEGVQRREIKVDLTTI